jgi:hypothetical protein
VADKLILRIILYIRTSLDMNRNSNNEGNRLTDPGRESSGNGNRSRGSKVGSVKENEMVLIKDDLKINTSINRETDIKEPLMEKTEVRIFFVTFSYLTLALGFCC